MSFSLSIKLVLQCFLYAVVLIDIETKTEQELNVPKQYGKLPAYIAVRWRKGCGELGEKWSALRNIRIILILTLHLLLMLLFYS